MGARLVVESDAALGEGSFHGAVIESARFDRCTEEGFGC
jgi:hypothetical protein